MKFIFQKKKYLGSFLDAVNLDNPTKTMETQQVALCVLYTVVKANTVFMEKTGSFFSFVGIQKQLGLITKQTMMTKKVVPLRTTLSVFFFLLYFT